MPPNRALTWHLFQNQPKSTEIRSTSNLSEPTSTYHRSPSPSSYHSITSNDVVKPRRSSITSPYPFNELMQQRILPLDSASAWPSPTPSRRYIIYSRRQPETDDDWWNLEAERIQSFFRMGPAKRKARRRRNILALNQSHDPRKLWRILWAVSVIEVFYRRYGWRFIEMRRRRMLRIQLRHQKINSNSTQPQEDIQVHSTPKRNTPPPRLEVDPIESVEWETQALTRMQEARHLAELQLLLKKEEMNRQSIKQEEWLEWESIMEEEKKSREHLQLHQRHSDSRNKMLLKLLDQEKERKYATEREELQIMESMEERSRHSIELHQEREHHALSALGEALRTQFNHMMKERQEEDAALLRAKLEAERQAKLKEQELLKEQKSSQLELQRKASDVAKKIRIEEELRRHEIYEQAKNHLDTMEDELSKKIIQDQNRKRESEKWYKTVKNAAEVLQRAFKCYLAKQKAGRYRRGAEIRNEKCDRRQLKNAAATIIQSNWRKRQAQKRVNKLHSRSQRRSRPMGSISVSTVERSTSISDLPWNDERRQSRLALLEELRRLQNFQQEQSKISERSNSKILPEPPVTEISNSKGSVEDSREETPDVKRPSITSERRKISLIERLAKEQEEQLTWARLKDLESSTNRQIDDLRAEIDAKLEMLRREQAILRDYGSLKGIERQLDQRDVIERQSKNDSQAVLSKVQDLQKQIEMDKNKLSEFKKKQEDLQSQVSAQNQKLSEIENQRKNNVEVPSRKTSKANSLAPEPTKATIGTSPAPSRGNSLDSNTTHKTQLDIQSTVPLIDPQPQEIETNRSSKITSSRPPSEIGEIRNRDEYPTEMSDTPRTYQEPMSPSPSLQSISNSLYRDHANTEPSNSNPPSRRQSELGPSRYYAFKPAIPQNHKTDIEAQPIATNTKPIRVVRSVTAPVSPSSSHLEAAKTNQHIMSPTALELFEELNKEEDNEMAKQVKIVNRTEIKGPSRYETTPITKQQQQQQQQPIRVSISSTSALSPHSPLIEAKKNSLNSPQSVITEPAFVRVHSPSSSMEDVLLEQLSRQQELLQVIEKQRDDAQELARDAISNLNQQSSSSAYQTNIPSTTNSASSAVIVSRKTLNTNTSAPTSNTKSSNTKIIRHQSAITNSNPTTSSTAQVTKPGSTKLNQQIQQQPQQSTQDQQNYPQTTHQYQMPQQYSQQQNAQQYQIPQPQPQQLHQHQQSTPQYFTQTTQQIPRQHSQQITQQNQVPQPQPQQLHQQHSQQEQQQQQSTPKYSAQTTQHIPRQHSQQITQQYQVPQQQQQQQQQLQRQHSQQPSRQPSTVNDYNGSNAAQQATYTNSVNQKPTTTFNSNNTKHNTNSQPVANKTTLIRASTLPANSKQRNQDFTSVKDIKPSESKRESDSPLIDPTMAYDLPFPDPEHLLKRYYATELRMKQSHPNEAAARRERRHAARAKAESEMTSKSSRYVDQAVGNADVTQLIDQYASTEWPSTQDDSTDPMEISLRNKVSQTSENGRPLDVTRSVRNEQQSLELWKKREAAKQEMAVLQALEASINERARNETDNARATKTPSNLADDLLQTTTNDVSQPPVLTELERARARLRTQEEALMSLDDQRRLYVATQRVRTKQLEAEVEFHQQKIKEYEIEFNEIENQRNQEVFASYERIRDLEMALQIAKLRQEDFEQDFNFMDDRHRDNLELEKKKVREMEIELEIEKGRQKEHTKALEELAERRKNEIERALTVTKELEDELEAEKLKQKEYEKQLAEAEAKRRGDANRHKEEIKRLEEEMERRTRSQAKELAMEVVKELSGAKTDQENWIKALMGSVVQQNPQVAAQPQIQQQPAPITTVVVEKDPKDKWELEKERQRVKELEDQLEKERRANQRRDSEATKQKNVVEQLQLRQMQWERENELKRQMQEKELSMKLQMLQQQQMIQKAEHERELEKVARAAAASAQREKIVKLVRPPAAPAASTALIAGTDEVIQPNPNNEANAQGPPNEPIAFYKYVYDPETDNNGDLTGRIMDDNKLIEAVKGQVIKPEIANRYIIEAPYQPIPYSDPQKLESKIMSGNRYGMEVPYQNTINSFQGSYPAGGPRGLRSRRKRSIVQSGGSTRSSLQPALTYTAAMQAGSMLASTVGKDGWVVKRDWDRDTDTTDIWDKAKKSPLFRDGHAPHYVVQSSDPRIRADEDAFNAVNSVINLPATLSVHKKQLRHVLGRPIIVT